MLLAVLLRLQPESETVSEHGFDAGVQALHWIL